MSSRDTTSSGTRSVQKLGRWRHSERSAPLPVLCALLWAFPVFAQPQQSSVETERPGSELRAQVAQASISGTVVDPSGAAVSDARVELKRDDPSANQETSSGSDGQFLFSNVPPGPFQLALTAKGFATQTLSGILHEGEDYNTSRIALALAAEKTEVEVVVPRLEIAEEQIKEEEKQRVLGILPNFYVSYLPDAAPLAPRQKFELAWRWTLDPATLLVTGAVAGIQQADNVFSGYGRGAQGYGKRFGADFANSASAVFIGSAILPSVLKQDPRYFYRGSGTVRSRFWYAVAMAVVCRGDNGRWQPNYSNVLGSLAAGGLSNLYYPPQDRHGAGLTFENAAIEIGSSAAANLLQEFVIRKLTPNSRNHDPSKP